MYATWAQALAPWMIPGAAFAAIAIPTGIFLLAWSGKRRFSRRNFAGVEEFGSYGHAVGSRLVESLISGFGALLLLAGMLGAFASGYGLFLQRY